MIKKLERTTKPFVKKKCYVSIYEVMEPNIQKYWIVETCDNQGEIIEERTEDYTWALYKFYFELCWLLNSKKMSETIKLSFE